MQVLGQATIFKNDKGTYKLSVMNKETQEDGTEKNTFMPINVGFRKGVEVKNKTKIDIKDAFLTFFKIDTGTTTEDGRPIYKKFPKIMIMDFDVLEEGIDEVYHTKNYSDTQESVVENEMEGFYPPMSEDELPF